VGSARLTAALTRISQRRRGMPARAPMPTVPTAGSEVGEFLTSGDEPAAPAAGQMEGPHVRVQPARFSQATGALATGK
jgi:hypothetical protein